MTPELPAHIYEFGDFRLDAVKRRLARRDSTAVPLTPRVFDTLLFLVEHANVVLDKERLMEAVWPDSIVEENNLSQNISTLRRLLGETRGAPRYIVTVPGRGYRFAAEVVAQPNGVAPAEPAPEKSEPAPEVSPQTPRATGWKIWTAAAAVVVLGLLSGTYFWRSATDRFSPPAKSIAVLPFQNLSNDPANAYFADGITDEVLTHLAKVSALKVVSRTSTQEFQKAPDSLRNIARQLGVAHILEGSVQRSGDRVRVTVQLIDARTDTHLWADEFDRKLTDLFVVESEIAQRITTSLAATLTGPEQQALDARPTANPQAHEAYLKGRFFWNKRTTEGYRQAVSYFNRAIALDPTYAQAYAGLADDLLLLASQSVPERKQALSDARRALQKSLQLDPNLSEAHDTAGLLQMNFDGDWAAGEREFQRAIALQPNNATAHQRYGEFLVFLGRPEGAIAESSLARELDPLSLIINADLGKVLWLGGHLDEAIAQLRRTVEMDPDFVLAHAVLAITYSEKGMNEQAIREFRQVKGWENDPLLMSWLTTIYARAGDRAQAAETLKRLKDFAQRTYASPLMLAVGCAAVGQNDEAFAWLDRMLTEQTAAGAITLRINPFLRGLRSDPRYEQLLQRAHFAPAGNSTPSKSAVGARRTEAYGAVSV